jgi:ELWxxDGT repeat protein
MVKDIYPGSNAASILRDFTVYNNKLYFTASDTFPGIGINAEVWVTDGTAGGTQMVKDICPVLTPMSHQELFTYKKQFYISTLLAANDQRLFRSDGTAVGTTMIAPPGSTTANPLPYAFYMFDSTLFFVAAYNNTGRELWSLKDTTTYPPPPTGVNTAINNPSFALYPNPNDGSFTIQLENQQFEKGTVSVYDMLGREVYQSTINKQSQIINLNNPPKGIYLIKLQLDDVILTRRMTVE